MLKVNKTEVSTTDIKATKILKDGIEIIGGELHMRGRIIMNTLYEDYKQAKKEIETLKSRISSLEGQVALIANTK